MLSSSDSGEEQHTCFGRFGRSIRTLRTILSRRRHTPIHSASPLPLYPYPVLTMARRARVTVRQSLDDLQRRLTSERHPEIAARLRLLILLKKEPAISNSDLRDRLDRSTATIGRWIQQYLRFGLRTFLTSSDKGGRRKPLVDDAIIREMRQLEKSGAVSGPTQFRSWLQKTKGIEISRTGMRDLLKRNGLRTAALKGCGGVIPSAPGASRGARSGLPRRNSTTTAHVDPPVLVDSLSTFADLLPSGYERVQVITAVQSIIKTAITSVDRVSIDVNTGCPLLNSEDYNPDVYISQVILPGRREPILSIQPAAGPGGYATRILEKFEQEYQTSRIYHPAVWREYYCHRNVYLGSVFLWRELARPALSEYDIQTLDRLEHLISHFLVEVVLRHNYINPNERAFLDTVEQIVKEYGLTKSEMTVLTGRLHGLSNQEISDGANMGINAVKKHTAHLLRKCGTKNVLELFARHFTTILRDRI